MPVATRTIGHLTGTRANKGANSARKRRSLIKPSAGIYKRPYPFVLKEVDPNPDLESSPVTITLASNQRYAEIHLHPQRIKPVDYPQPGGY